MNRTHRPITSPGAIIGYRSNGTPIRLIAGGSEPAPEPPTTPPAPATPAPAAPAAPSPATGTAPPPAPADPPAPPASGPQPPAGQEPATPALADAASVDELPPWAQKIVREARRGEADGRTRAKAEADARAAAEAKHQEALDGIAKALGLKPDEVTPEQLATERDQAKAAADQAAARATASAVELAVFRQAAAAQVDGNALLDSRSFVASLAGLDPAAGDFAQRVTDAINAAAEQHPGWKLAVPAPASAAPPAPPVPPAPPAIPASSPSQFTGPPGAPRQLTAADAVNMSPQQVTDAINQGLFTGEGFGPKRSTRR